MKVIQCRVWDLHQARCLLCDWAGEITGVRADAADDAREHRASDEHKQRCRGGARQPGPDARARDEGRS